MSASLQAALLRADRQPAVAVLVADQPPEAPRLAELSARYSGSEPDAPFDAAATAAGTIVRAYLSSGVVKAQVVSVSAMGSAWSTWVTLDSAAGAWANTAPVAVRGSATDGTAQCFWTAADGHTIRWARWDGATWGAASTVVDVGPGLLVSSLASEGLDGVIRLFFVLSGGALSETHWDGTSWSTPLSDGGVYFQPTIADGFSNDHFLAICSASPTTLQVKQFRVGSGSGWGPAGTLLTAGDGTGYSYRYPKLMETSPSYPRAVLTWSEEAPAPVGTWPMIAFTPSRTWVTGVVPWRYGGAFGVKVLRDARANPDWWVISSNQVSSCPADRADVASGQRVAFRGDQIVAIRISQRRPNQPATAAVTVLNDGGHLRDAGQAGPHRALRAWSQVAISLGYHTGQGGGGQGLEAGAEGCWQLPLWIDSVVFHDDTATGQPLVTLHLIDAWGMLERLTQRSSYSYANEIADLIVRRILWHVSADRVTPAQPRLTSLLLSTFTLRAGEPLAIPLRRLAELAGVVIVFGTFPTARDGTGWDSISVAPRPWGQAGGSPLWEFGGAGQPIVQGEVAARVTPSATGVQVAGSASVSVARDWESVWLLWRDTPVRLVERGLASQAMTDQAAAQVASLVATERYGGALRCWVNPGLEIGDVVKVTIDSAPAIDPGLTVAGLEISYERSRGTYQETIYLEGTSDAG